MKKIFITAMAALAISTAAFSQTKHNVEFGVGIGYNSASVSVGNGNYTADYKGGFNAAISADNYFSDTWSLKVKAIYDQRGWANGYLSVGNNSITTDYQLDYLTIPVLANWHFGRKRNWYLNFGPYVSFLMTAKATASSIDVKPAFSSTDGGLDVGIGIKLPIAEKAKFFIEFNGEGGVANVNGGNNGSTFHNTTSAFNVGINF